MKNKLNTTLIIALLLLLIAAIGGFYFWKTKQDQEKQKLATLASAALVPIESALPIETLPSEENSALQTELNNLTKQTIGNIQAEQRLNLNMAAQLNSYKAIISQLQEYSNQIEGNINLIKEISKEDFQENVAMQALLFTGKKPELVAKHLEEFDPMRVGAILSKMKEKEAGQVFDVWAVSPPVQASTNFYRDVMAAYLANRRRDLHPELFKNSSLDQSQNKLQLYDTTMTQVPGQQEAIALPPSQALPNSNPNPSINIPLKTKTITP